MFKKQTMNCSKALLCSLVILSACATSNEEPQTGNHQAELTYGIDGTPYLSKFERLARFRIKQKSQDEQSFHDLLTFVYGDYDVVIAESIRQQILSDDFSWTPDTQIVTKEVLPNAAAAYSEDTGLVYLRHDMPQRFERTLIYLEEVGHHLDILLKDEDTPGDEGALFRTAVFGAPISKDQERALRQENDTGTIFYNGEEIQVEYFLFFDWLDDVWELLEHAWDNASSAWSFVEERLFWNTVDLLTAEYDKIKTLGSLLEDGNDALFLIGTGLEKLANGQFSNGINEIFQGTMQISMFPTATTQATISVIMTDLLHHISAIQRLVFGEGRTLTSQELTDARKIFGDKAWLNYVRIFDTKVEAGAFAISPDPFTLEYTVYMKSYTDQKHWNGYSNAFKEQLYKDTIIHELVHCFQFASGDGSYKFLSVRDRIIQEAGGTESYTWTNDANQGILFASMRVEQQGKFIENAYSAGCFELDPWQQCYIEGVNRTTLLSSAHRALYSGIWHTGVLPPALITASVL